MQSSKSVSAKIQPVFNQNGMTLYQCDVLSGLRSLPSLSVGGAFTSIPYFRAADYEQEGQHGQEDTLEAYLETQVIVAQAVHRVLAESKILAINVGNISNNYSPVYAKGKVRSGNWTNRRPLQKGIVGGVKKTLMQGSDLLVPWRLAIALQEQIGFHYLGSLTWRKTGSGGNRATKLAKDNGEPILFFVKQSRGNRTPPNLLTAFDSAFLDIPVDTNRKEHRCPFPPLLPYTIWQHIILDKSLPILDYYCGSGTSIVEAYKLGIPAIGIDLDCAEAITECQKALRGEATPTHPPQSKRQKKSVGNSPQSKRERETPTGGRGRRQKPSGWIEGEDRVHYRWLVNGRCPAIALKTPEIRQEVQKMIDERKTVEQIRQYLGE